MPHAVDEAASVIGLLAQDAAQVIGYLPLVGVVDDRVHQVLVHARDLDVGAAVLGALERADAPGVRGVGVGAARGEHARRERGVVAAAVLGVQHEHDVEHARLLRRPLHVVTEHVEHRLGSGQAGQRRVDVHCRRRVLVLARGQVREHGDAGQAAQHLHGDLHLVLGVDDVGFGGAVHRVEHEHRAGHHVHDVFGREVHDEVVDEAARQVAVRVDRRAEALELGGRRQVAREQKVCDFLVAGTPFGNCPVHQVLDVVAANRQASLVGNLHAFVGEVAVYVRNGGDAGDDARAVCVSQAALDVEMVVIALVVAAVGTEVLEYLGLFGLGHGCSFPLVVEWTRGCNPRVCDPQLYASEPRIRP